MYLDKSVTWSYIDVYIQAYDHTQNNTHDHLPQNVVLKKKIKSVVKLSEHETPCLSFALYIRCKSKRAKLSQ